MPGIRCLIRKAQPRRWTLTVSQGARLLGFLLMFWSLGLLDGTALWAAEGPVITNSPVSFTAVVGQNHTFTVVAGGTAPLSYYWYKNNILLPSETSAGLTLTSIQTSHAGDYKVVVSNTVTTATGQVAKLTVRLPSDPKFAPPN